MRLSVFSGQEVPLAQDFHEVETKSDQFAETAWEWAQADPADEVDKISRLVRNNGLRTAAVLVERDDKGPMRPVGRRRGKRPGHLYYSQKNGRHIGCESKNERNSMLFAEIDPDVLAYREQPHRLEIEIDGKKRTYTPDREDVLRDGGVVIVEVKDTFEEREDPDYAIKLRRCAEIYADLGWAFKIVEREEIEAAPAFGAVFKIQSHRRVAFSAREVRTINARILGGAQYLGDLMTEFGSVPEATGKLCSMAAAGKLRIGLDRPFNENSRVSVV